MIEEPNKEKVREILKKIKPIYEKYHKVTVSEEIINLITDLSEKYIYKRFEPDKSIDILDEVCSLVSLKETKKLKKYNQLNKTEVKVNVVLILIILIVKRVLAHSLSLN